MPTLRPLTEVARTDAKFFVDTLLPAIAAAGYAGAVALVVDGAPYGDVDGAEVVIEGTAADLEGMLAGKLKKESALDKLKAKKRASAAAGVCVRGRASALRALVVALAPREAAHGGAREIGGEAGAVKTKKRDRVRTIDGRYIKGMVSGRSKEKAPPSAPVVTSVMGGQKSTPTDRTGFALQNLAAFVSAGLARVVGASDAGADEILEVRRV